MLTLKQLGPNQTQLNVDGLEVLFSYETPVACRLRDGTWRQTSTKHSNTTTKHIKQWLAGAVAPKAEQSFFDNLLQY